ncbi:MAG: hypothetical protein ONB25_09040, partial [candidate division KSB1 bacterium]|nr:hypothetical protein [candidate division KSB1 bacterium]
DEQRDFGARRDFDCNACGRKSQRSVVKIQREIPEYGNMYFLTVVLQALKSERGCGPLEKTKILAPCDHVQRPLGSRCQRSGTAK